MRFHRIGIINGVNTLDIREIIHAEGLSHHELFYNTDHHWKAETGLWASGKILEKIKDMGYETNPSKVSSDKFDYAIYENCFLGSQGKKATLAQATPDDFCLIYPKQETLFHYTIPSIEIDKTGDFSIMYNKDCIIESNVVTTSAYATYNYSDNAVTNIENLLTDKEDKILILHDSFSNCVLSFLALDAKNIYSLDLRLFTGSVKSYIDECKPDIVIVAYQCDALGKVDYSAHKALFDFR